MFNDVAGPEIHRQRHEFQGGPVNQAENGQANPGAVTGDRSDCRVDSWAEESGGKYLVKANLAQSEVNRNFVALVPIYADLDGKMSLIGRVRMVGNSRIRDGKTIIGVLWLARQAAARTRNRQ